MSRVRHFKRLFAPSGLIGLRALMRRWAKSSGDEPASSKTVGYLPTAL